jgi:hypothetical protein
MYLHVIDEHCSLCIAIRVAMRRKVSVTGLEEAYLYP